MGRIIAVGNLKGGTGKSTIAVNLACRLAEKQRSVVLIDADPQGTAAAWLRNGPPRGLSLVSLALARATANAMWTEQISSMRHCYDRIVIDLPPQAGECFEATLCIADLLIVPLTLSEVDLHATAQAIAVLNRMQVVRSGRPSCMLVPSKVDRRTSLGRQASTSLAKLGWAVGWRSASARRTARPSRPPDGSARMPPAAPRRWRSVRSSSRSRTSSSVARRSPTTTGQSRSVR